MDTEFLIASSLRFAINLIYSVVAIILGILAFKSFDKYLFKNIDFVEETQKGNIAAAILASAILAFIAVVIGLALR